MNRIDHRSQRLDNLLFATVLASAALCAGWLATAGAAPIGAPAVAAAAPHVELQRVVVVGVRDTAPPAVAATIQLPRVVITARRTDQPAVARAASREQPEG